ncbi:type-F conjugative transfer system secretin TraK [Marinobacter sp. P4B1]|uniref:TraK domain-containing protein n=1 Tax=Marinobacter sp. P4B1 TaxID=1119533 RepID=UPI00071DEDEE|nr:type-F conjugative transfer system secretin TraK [Marinobacter sp. P4B1]KRW83737.1 hypothetical protein AQ621_16950 [Marinobacter sp. P4B1]
MKRSILASLVAASLMNATPANAEPLIAAADLPGIPLSVTDPVRKTAPPKASNAGSSSTPSSQAESSKPVEARVNSSRLNSELRKLQGELLSASGNGKATESEQAGNTATPQGSGNIVMEPGVNEILQISRGHPNRILLPFENPKIQTTAADAQIKTDGSVVFVATNSTRPVTLFVSPHENPRMALSLTLVPSAMPPSQYEISLSEDAIGIPAGGYFMGNSTAEKWEKRGNYTRALVDLFEELAKENLPQGYKLRSPAIQDVHTCFSGPQVQYEVAQVAEGHHLVVQILVATNTGNEPVEVIGSHCAAEGVVAAAEWPNSILEPSQQTEMYVAFERKPAAQKKSRRPSALGGR